MTRHDTFPTVRFEIFPAGDGWRFRLVCGGDTLLLSVGDHASSDGALREIERLRDPQSRCQACMASDGSFYFDCRTATGEVIGTSRMFEVPRERDEARGMVKRFLLGDIVVAHRDD